METSVTLLRSAYQERSAATMPGFSVVVPVHDEAGAILPLLDELVAKLRGLGPFEIVVVDDGSRDATAAELATARRLLPELRVLTQDERRGQSVALATGILAAATPVVVTMDGDGQNVPGDIPRLLERWRATDPGQLHMVCGHREERKDRWLKRFGSRVANAVRSRVLGDGIPDTGCGLKVFPKELFLALPRFDHMHRFLPALAKSRGATVSVVPVRHRPRRAGRSKYGLVDRLTAGLLDLFGVWWLQRRCLAPVLRQGIAGCEEDGR